MVLCMVDKITHSLPPSYGDSGNDSSYGNNPQFVALVEAVWQEIQAYRNDPSDLNIQTLMRTVDTLNAYFTKNGVPPAGDKEATDLYNILNGEAPGNESLAALCESGSASVVAYFQQQFDSGNDLFAGLYGVLNNYGHSSFDKGNTTLQKDLESLLTALNNYSQDPGDYGPIVAKYISKFLADAKASGITDGYLTNIVTFLNTNISTASGSTSLAALAANFANDPGAFNNALNNLTKGSAGADLSWLVESSLEEEWG